MRSRQLQQNKSAGISGKECRRSGALRSIRAAGIVLAAFVLLSLITTPIAYRILFCRSETPKYAVEMSGTAAEEAGICTEEVYFLSGKNSLYGEFFYTDEQEKGVIIVVNGMNAGVETHLPEILYFAQHGYDVFTYDGTGVRKSEGSTQRSLSQGYTDLLAAIDTVRKSEGGAEDIYLYGHSMGGMTAAAVLAGTDEVCAAVCLAAPVSPLGTMLHYAAKYVGPLAYAEYPFLLLWDRTLCGSGSDRSALDGINSCDTPVLIVQGAEDEVLLKSTSLYEARDRITNPNAEYLYVEEPYRNRHSTLWLSAEGAEGYLKATAELSALKKEYDGNIPADVWREFTDQSDEEAVFVTDEEFMRTITDFYDNSAAAE